MDMTPASVRPILTLGGGVIIGLLIAWGLGHLSTASPNAALTPSTTPTQVALQTKASPSPSPAEETVVAQVKPSPSQSGSVSAESQLNGLPFGVTQSALNYNKKLYNKYPGLQPPLINTDGRNLGPEAIQRLQGPITMLANPGGTPLSPATPAQSAHQFPLLNGAAIPVPTVSNQ